MPDTNCTKGSCVGRNRSGLEHLTEPLRDSPQTVRVAQLPVSPSWPASITWMKGPPVTMELTVCDMPSYHTMVPSY